MFLSLPFACGLNSLGLHTPGIARVRALRDAHGVGVLGAWAKKSRCVFFRCLHIFSSGLLLFCSVG